MFALALAVRGLPAATAASEFRQVKITDGIQCTPYGETHAAGPRSFSIGSIGKAGVPPLNLVELAIVRTIERFVRSKTLRFVFVPWPEPHRKLTRPGLEFVVFDARGGPCADFAPGYEVLKGVCNEYYEPGENPFRTHAMSGCLGTPTPWIKKLPRGHRRAFIRLLVVVCPLLREDGRARGDGPLPFDKLRVTTTSAG